MPLLTVIIILVAVGVILWAIEKYLPMDAQIKRILQIVVIVAVVIWLASLFGIFGDINAVRVGKP